MTDAEVTASFDFFDKPYLPVSTTMRSYIERMRPAVRLAREASRADFLAIDADRSNPFARSAEHLADLRAASYLFAYDMELRWRDGDGAGAVDLISAHVDLARHAASDPYFIDALTSAGLASRVTTFAGAAIDRGDIDPVEADRLRRSMRHLTRDPDPFGIRRAVHKRIQCWNGSPSNSPERRTWRPFTKQWVGPTILKMILN